MGSRGKLGREVRSFRYIFIVIGNASERAWEPRKSGAKGGLTMGMTPHTLRTLHNYVLCIWHLGNSG